MPSVFTILSLALLLPVFAQLAAAGEADEAKAIVEKAIEAAGGRKNLEKFNTMTSTEKGTYYGMGEGLPYTGKMAIQMPDKVRMEIEGFFTMIVNGDKGWTIMGGDVTEMPEEQIKGQIASHYAGYVATLLPLEDEKFTLKKLADAEVNGSPASVVVVSSKDHQDVTLSFDKKSGMLVKALFKAFDAEQGKEAEYENFYQEYKEVDGAKMVWKMLMNRDGKKFVESQMTEVKPAKDIDAMFEKP